MIMEKEITKKQAQKLVTMLEEWTRCEILSRHREFRISLDWADYFQMKLKYEDKIRKKLFGSSDLVELGYKWGLLKDKKERKK